MEKTRFEGVDHAKLYSLFKPPPPQMIVKKIIGYLREKHSGPLCNALDVGCGPGQSTGVLSPFFNKVIGVDASEAQIQEARVTRMKDNVEYLVCPAEELPVEDTSIDLVTCVCSLHWFDIPKFFSEVQRVLVPEGVVAVYGRRRYFPVSDDPDKNRKLEAIYKGVFRFLGKFDSPQTKLLLDEYKDVDFPLDDLKRKSSISVDYPGTAADWPGIVSSSSFYQQIKETNPGKAKFITEFVETGLSEIFGLGTDDLQNVPLNYRAEYFLIVGRKREIN